MIVPTPKMLATKNHKLFSKSETISLVIIFTILIVVSIPNFAASLRRARDQNRRDDLGAMEASLGGYFGDFDAFPLSSSDGKIMDCLKPGDAPYKDAKGFWVVNPISCEWGKDSLSNLINGKTYLTKLPIDPRSNDGISYIYLSNGQMYQLFTYMEGADEAEVSQIVIARNLSCGNHICNVGRSYNCDIAKTLETCEKEAILLQK